MKKILYIHHGRGIGGAPLSLLYLLQKLDRSKYDPTVLCLYESEAADLYRKEGIETIIAKGIYEFSHTQLSWINIKNFYIFLPQIFFLISSIIRTLFFIRKLKPDIVHLNSSTLLPCVIGAKMAGCKVVWHIREPIHEGYFGLRKRLLRWGINRFSDRIIAICKNDADIVGQGFSPAKIKVIYNFVDFKKFNKEISGEFFRREFNLKRGEKAVGMLGGIARTKGTMEFVKTAKVVKEKIGNPRLMTAGTGVKFFIIGEFPSNPPLPPFNKGGRGGIIKGFIKKVTGIENYYNQIKDFILREGLERDIIFTGVRIDIPKIIAGLDLVVFPSTVPHFARPIIEASVMGKPVVASDIGGPRELVIDGVTGRLCPPKDINALSESIIEILISNEISKKMGEAGYRFAKEKFDADKNARETFLLYEELAQ